jgi:hypothetical protein
MQGKVDLIVFAIEHQTKNPNIVGAVSDVLQSVLCPVLTVLGVA